MPQCCVKYYSSDTEVMKTKYCFAAKTSVIFDQHGLNSSSMCSCVCVSVIHASECVCASVGATKLILFVRLREITERCTCCRVIPPVCAHVLLSSFSFFESAPYSFNKDSLTHFQLLCFHISDTLKNFGSINACLDSFTHTTF